MARIEVGAGKGSRRARTGGVVARVNDALETSAALLGVQAAAHGGVAGADHARVGNGAKISEHAAFHGVARVGRALAVVVARGAGCVNAASAVHTGVDGTGVAVIADFRRELASCGGNAGVISALAVVIASNRREHAAARGIAAIHGALIVIIANDRGDLTSTYLAADSLVALVWRSAVGDGGVYATLGPSGGGSNLHAASVDGAVVVVIAILVDDSRSAARLARALAHAAPVLVAAVERETSSKLKSRIRGVPFAVEEVQTVVVALFQEGESIQAHLFGRLRMQGAKVNHKFGVNEHPQVIVTEELEDLATDVPKTSVRLHAEPEVVLDIFIGVVPAPVAPSPVVDGEEILVRIHVISSGRSRERDVDGDGLVLLGAVEPVVERGGAVHVALRGLAAVAVHGGEVRAEQAAVLEAVAAVAFVTTKTPFVVIVVISAHLEIGVVESFRVVRCAWVSATAKHSIGGLVSNNTLHVDNGVVVAARGQGGAN